MKNLMMKCSGMIAALALMVATMNMNSTCLFRVYQEPVPDSAKKLSKVK